MSISFVAGVANFDISGASSGTYATSSSLNVTSGDTIVVEIRNSTVSIYCTGITDTAGNTYRVAGKMAAGNFGKAEVWYCTNCAAHATNIITATFNLTDSYRGIAAAQFRGLATISPLDVVVAKYDGSVANITSPAFTTAVANSVLVACAMICATGFAWTPDSGWTEACEDSNNVQEIQYKIVSSIQTGVTVLGTNADLSFKTMIVISLHEELSSGGGGASVSSSVLKGSRVIPYSSNYY